MYVHVQPASLFYPDGLEQRRPCTTAATPEDDSDNVRMTMKMTLDGYLVCGSSGVFDRHNLHRVQQQVQSKYKVLQTKQNTLLWTRGFIGDATFPAVDSVAQQAGLERELVLQTDN
ncbi:hypothetical protein AWENTII_004529 [Aspergillus wentii]